MPLTQAERDEADRILDIHLLKQEVEKLRRELKKAHDRIDGLEAQVYELCDNTRRRPFPNPDA